MSTREIYFLTFEINNFTSHQGNGVGRAIHR